MCTIIMHNIVYALCSCLQSLQEILIESSDEEDEHIESVPPAILSLAVFMLSWQATFKIPDTCLAALLVFLYHFLSLVGTLTVSTQLCQFSNMLPRNVQMLRKITLIDVDTFTSYVACPLCHSLYNYADCVITTGNRKEVKQCQHIPFPNYPQATYRKRCDQLLLKTCKGRKNTVFRPFKVYCCQSIIQSLSKLLSRSNFLIRCEDWRNRVLPSTILADVYDGCIWKEFVNFRGRPFLSEPYCLAFSLNVDWFQPFKHVTDSVGAIYITILNLPRYLRYRPENIILCGVIPGPKEPKDLNVYLQPIVQELLLLWEGVMMDIQSYGSINIKGALLCITSDLPATRKVCGFASHSASFGCSKCFKKFKTVGDKLDYSGFEKRGMEAKEFRRSQNN